MTDLSKDTLRQEALRHRERIHVFGNEDVEAACENFFDALQPRKEQIIALYWPMDKEFDTGGILERLLKEGYSCALPVIRKGDKVLGFARWQDGEALIDGPYNVLQPADNEATQWVDPDIIIVPLLAFDRKGNRLGYGGGYYDATLRALRQKKTITAVGIGFAQQAVLFNLPVEEHDEKLDWVITPQKVHRFGD